MSIAKLSAVIVTGALSIISVQTPASAASLATNVFLTNIMPNVDFLDRSSRFALTNSKSGHVKDFAKGEAKEQTLAANALDQWINADKAALAVLASAAGPDDVQTGRSVAIDAPPAQDTQGTQVVDERVTLGEEDLDSLEGLTGREFDDEYRTKQLNALTQVETDYKTYLATGDDGDLLKIARRELPKIEHRLAELRKI